jgi:hypothetical protein
MKHIDEALRFTGSYLVTTPDEQLLIQTVSDGTVRVARRADSSDSWQPPVWGQAIPYE